MREASLRERKQRQAREKIVQAAYELFAERGFDAVTVTDVAERAEVGRTTFFRYFGDKQEVVFADEQRHNERLAAVVASTPEAPVDDLPAALRLVRTIVVALSGDVVADPDRYAAHHTLVTRHPELGDRMHRKRDRLTADVRGVLRQRGADQETAALAARIGIACFEAAWDTAGRDATALMPALARAFDSLGFIEPTTKGSRDAEVPRPTRS